MLSYDKTWYEDEKISLFGIDYYTAEHKKEENGYLNVY
jgi:hypothetical protein